MQVTEIPLSDPMVYRNFLEVDEINAQSSSYRTNRGMEDIFSVSYIPVNYYDLLTVIRKGADAPVKVLEGGCGLGKALKDLKRGIFYSDTLTPSQEKAHFPRRVIDWRKSLVGRKMDGLGDDIVTTGLTLSPAHRDEIRSGGYSHLIDHLVVGSLDDYAWNTRDRYDFIFDFFGPSFHSPLEAIPAYHWLLKQGGIGNFKLLGYPEQLALYLREILSCGYEILDRGGQDTEQSVALDVLVKRV